MSASCRNFLSYIAAVTTPPSGAQPSVCKYVERFYYGTNSSFVILLKNCTSYLTPLRLLRSHIVFQKLPNEMNIIGLQLAFLDLYAAALCFICGSPSYFNPSTCIGCIDDDYCLDNVTNFLNQRHQRYLLSRLNCHMLKITKI